MYGSSFLSFLRKSFSDAVRICAFQVNFFLSAVEMLKNHLTAVTDEETVVNGRVFFERLRVCVCQLKSEKREDVERRRRNSRRRANKTKKIPDEMRRG